MNKIERYQDLYRKAWEIQNEIDTRTRRISEARSRMEMKKAPKPKSEQTQSLTPEETMIKNALRMGLHTENIAQLIGKSHTTVRRRIQALKDMGVVEK